MPRYVALLRGINVGGNKKVPMADLRTLLVRLGYSDVATLLNSGNAVFTSGEKNPAKVVAQLEAAIEKHFGFEVAVVLRKRDEVAQAIDRNPMPVAVAEPSRFFVVFCSAPPDKTRLAELALLARAGEKFQVVGSDIYLHAPAGAGESKLAVALSSPKLGVTPTARNWNTVTKLLALLDAA